MWKWVVTLDVQELYRWMLQARVHIVVVRVILAKIGFDRRCVESMVNYYSPKPWLTSQCMWAKSHSDWQTMGWALTCIDVYDFHCHVKKGTPRVNNDFMLSWVSWKNCFRYKNVLKYYTDSRVTFEIFEAITLQIKSLSWVAWKNCFQI